MCAVGNCPYTPQSFSLNFWNSLEVGGMKSDNRRNMTGNWVHPGGWYLSQACFLNEPSTWGPDTRTRVGFLWPSPYIQGGKIKQFSEHKTWGLCCRCLLVGPLVWFLETKYGYVTQASLELTSLQTNLNSPSYFSVPRSGAQGAPIRNPLTSS